MSTAPAPPPDPAPLAADPRFRRGLALFRAGEYFECHEVWEDVWREARPPRRLFIQSLIHLAVASHHRRQGNPGGAARQWAKGLKKLAAYLPACEGIDTWRLYRACAAAEPGADLPPAALSLLS